MGSGLGMCHQDELKVLCLHRNFLAYFSPRQCHTLNAFTHPVRLHISL